MYPVLELKFPYVIKKADSKSDKIMKVHHLSISSFFGDTFLWRFKHFRIQAIVSIPPLEQFTVCEKQQNEESTRIRQISRVCLSLSITQLYFGANVVANGIILQSGRSYQSNR